MKTRLIVVFLIVFSALAVTAQTQHIKFRQAGEFASLSSNPDQFTSINLSVSRTSSTNTAPTATLNYSAVTVAPDFSSETFVLVVGAFPANDFSGQTTQHLVLDLDLSELDPNNSLAESCTFDLINFIETCGAPPTGTIHLEFSENDIQRTQLLAFDEVITNGATTTHIHQKSDNSTANVQGSILGMPFTSPTATVGVNKEATLEVIKN